MTTLDQYIQAIEEREAAVHAWIYYDSSAVREAAQKLTQSVPDGELWGLPIGVKDIIDTADMATQYGSSAYRGHRPARDAWVITRLKAAGALVMGKTVTTEFAFTHAGPTRNPHHPDHTPGGSSSGSAAAVAAGMVPVALGSQTGGSTIRPSAYCGIVGFKPSYGLINLQGVMPLAPSLDTLGIHADTVRRAQQVFSVLSTQTTPAHKGSGPSESKPITIGWYPGPMADQAQPQAIKALSAALERIKKGRGVTVLDLPFDPEHYRALCEINQVVMRFEAARIHREVFEQSPGLLGASTVSMITEGFKIPAPVYDQAMTKRAVARLAFEQSMAGVDVAITLSSPGEAPLFTEGTGSSTFNQAWTTLGVPCITLPVGKGVNGLPLGIQLVARHGQDFKLLSVAEQFSEALGT